MNTSKDTPKEIERKFLIDNPAWQQEALLEVYDIEQCYLEVGRVRITTSQTGKQTGIYTLKTDIDPIHEFEKLWSQSLSSEPNSTLDNFNCFKDSWLQTPLHRAPDQLKVKNHHELYLFWDTLTHNVQGLYNLQNNTFELNSTVKSSGAEEVFFDNAVTANTQAYALRHIPAYVGKIEKEHEIPLDEAKAHMAKASRTIQKTRHVIDSGEGYCYEVDVFKNLDAPLTLMEVELKSEAQHIKIPAWAGLEVTDDPDYKNSVLIRRTPFLAASLTGVKHSALKR